MKCDFLKSMSIRVKGLCGRSDPITAWKELGVKRIGLLRESESRPRKFYKMLATLMKKLVIFLRVESLSVKKSSSFRPNYSLAANGSCVAGLSDFLDRLVIDPDWLAEGAIACNVPYFNTHPFLISHVYECRN